MSYIKEENVEKKLYYEVVSMIDKNKQHFKEIEDFLRKKYKKAGGRKKTHYDDSDFGIGDDEESEGYELDFLWKLLEDSDKKVDLNPKTVYDWAILLYKKAQEKHLRWTKPIHVELFTGFYADPFKKVLVRPEMVDYIDTYEDDVKKSSHRFNMIEKWLKERNVQTYKMEYDDWVFEIAYYYYETQNHLISTPEKLDLIKNLVFRPVNNEEKKPLYELVHYRIESQEIIEKIQELDNIEKNKKKTKRLLNNVLKKNNINNKEIIELSYHQNLFLLSTYWLNHKDEFKDDFIFHPQKREKDFEEHRIDVETIKMESIKRFSNYIEGSKKDTFMIELEKVKTWATQKKNKVNFDDMDENDWRELIKDYHKEEHINILESTIYYPKWKREKPHSLNHYIIDHEELTKEFDILDLMEFSSDEEDNEFF